MKLITKKLSLSITAIVFASTLSITQAQQTATVNAATQSAIIPTGLVAGDTFRLIFVTRNTSPGGAISNIGRANTHVQSAANSSAVTALQGFSSQFRALVSTATVNARDNTNTNRVKVTGKDTDAPIYWFGGDKVADNYADFYDDSWDSNLLRTENGIRPFALSTVFTGSTFDGTVKTGFGIDATNTVTGNPEALGDEIEKLRGSARNSVNQRYYGISPIFTVTGVAPSSDSDLSNLVVAATGLTITPATFAAATTTYSGSVASTVESVAVTPTVSDSGASVTVNGTTATSGSASIVTLSGGLNAILVVVTAADGSTKTYTINIMKARPVIAFTIDAITDASVSEGVAYTSSTPSISGDTPIGDITYTKSGNDADDFTINSSTGVVSMVARDYESPEDADTSNDYEITITATDDDGNTATQNWTVSVTNYLELGGVPINPALWVKADEGLTEASNVITGWTDQSPSAGVATPTGSPVLSSSFINFNPSVLFDGTNDHFEFSKANIIKGRDNFTFIAVAGENDALTVAHQHLLGTDQNGGVRITFRAGNIALHRSNVGDAILDPDPPVAQGDIGIVAISRSNGSDFATYQDGAEFTKTDTRTSLSYATNATKTYIGRGTGNSERLNGQIAELVVFEDVLSAVDLDKVQTHLAIKYGITLDSGVANYVNAAGTSVFDNSGTYVNDIVGIAKDDTSVLDQRISKSKNTESILTISTDATFTGVNSGHTDSLTDGQYLIIGNDGGATTTQATETPGTTTNRLVREWKVENTGSVGEINLKFDGLDDTYTLYTDADGDFSAGATEVGALNANGEIATTLADGTYFTFTASTPTITINEISGGYVNDADDENTIALSGTSTNIAAAQGISLTISDTDGTTGDVTSRALVVAGTGGATDTWTTGIDSAEMKGLAEGTITVTASYTGAADATQTFTYDTTAPGKPTVALSNDTGSSNTDKITNSLGFDFNNMEGGARTEKTLDGGTTWTALRSSSSFTNPSSVFSLLYATLAQAQTDGYDEGNNTVSIRQTDEAGNVSAVSDALTFTYDVTAPTLAAAIDDQRATVETDFTFQIPTGAFTDATALTYTSSGQSNGISFETDTWSGTGAGLTAGVVTITVTATDTAGNTQTDIFTITIAAAPDRTPPVLAAEIPDQTATVGTDFSFQIPTRTFTDANTLTYTSSGESNGISFATDTWSGTGAGLTAGTVTITVTATDVAGNITSDEFNIIITERGVLAITINPISGGYVNDTEDESPVTISGTSINIPTTENIRLMLTGLGSGRLATVGSDGTWSIGIPSLVIKGLTEGIITVDALHHQSNTKYATATFIYDRTAPVLATEIQDQTAPVGTDFSFQIPTETFTDANTLTYTSSGESNGISFATDTWSGAETGLTEGELTITVTATDAAGNSATDEFTITIAQLIDLALSIDAFLQGPYDTGASTNIMSDGLRAARSIPTTSPYGDRATIESTVLDVVTGEESNAIVDWVQVSLHDPTDTSVVIVTVPALLQRNGNVVALDGSSALQIQGVAGDYKVSINHRNHIPVITDATQSLSTTETTIDFTNDLTIVTGGSNAMAEVATGIYALFSGDVNGNNQVQVDDYNAAIQDVGRGGYLTSDVDMNGELQVSDINFVLKTLGKGAQF